MTGVHSLFSSCMDPQATLITPSPRHSSPRMLRGVGMVLTGAVVVLLVLAITTLVLVVHVDRDEDHDEDDGTWDPHLRVASYNIRCKNSGDTGPRAWENRRDLVASVVDFHRVNIVGMQEVLEEQLTDLLGLLDQKFDYVGVGREDGKRKGEFNPILYRWERFRLYVSGTFWLSETPDVPGSIGWDAGLPRIATWARFKDIRMDRTFLFVCTHFDNVGKEARNHSADLIIERLEQMRKDDEGLILVGDFNSHPTDPPQLVLHDHFLDARYASLTGNHGPSASFTGFDPQETPELIDYIFVTGSPTKVTVLHHGVIPEEWDNQQLPSDHRPLIADVVVPET